MKKYLGCVSMLALLVAGHAQAADVVQTYDAPEVAPVAVASAFSWDGVYIGGQLGGSWANSDVDSRFVSRDAAWTSGRLLSWSPDPSGFVGGIYAGYNFDLGNDVIIGLETDFVWGDVDDTTGYKTMDITFTGFLDPGPPPTGYDTMTARAGIEQKWAGATRIRAGYAMDRFLPYISAGIAYAKIKVSGDGQLVGVGGVPDRGLSVAASDTYTGWTIGAGSDYAVTDNVLLRLEYRYADYGDKTYSYDLDTATATIGDMKFKIDHKTHDIRFGIAYKF